MDVQAVVARLEASLPVRQGYTVEIMRSHDGFVYVTVADNRTGAFCSVLRGTDTEVAYVIAAMRRQREQG